MCKVRRRIAFGNPLVDFDKIAFIKHNRARYNHMCDQYFGFHANPGGGVYVLEDAFGEKPTVRDVLADAVCGNGRFKGRKLTPGSFMSLYSPVKARSVPLRRRISYCSGVSSARHSASVFSILVVMRTR